MKKIIGSFVFKDEGDGCLTSKFINREVSSPLTECSKLIQKTSNEKFLGKYFTVWLDTSTVPNNSYLEIKKIDQSYNLKWTKDEEEIYSGQAMLVGDLLVGAYWTSDLDNA